MENVIDARDWPLVYFTMPAQVADEQADAVLAQITAIYDRAAPFVLCMDGPALPQHSPQFLTAYLQWSKAHHALQQRYCRGAIRIEADSEARQRYQLHAVQYAASGQAAYPYHVVATEQEAHALAASLLGTP